MYLTKSLMDGLKILGFDKETIKKVAREKSLEEIFLSTLFMNYIIVLVIFLLTAINGGFQIAGREINMTAFFGLLMIYPFAFNLVVYFVYGLFGIIAEALNSSKKIKPLISVGFHSAIVYSVLFYVIALLSIFNMNYGLFLLGVFTLYFLLTMFLSLKVLYNFSEGQTLIVLMVPIIIIFIALMIVLVFVDARTLVNLFLKV